MAEYSKMKNVELEALLRERSLPHTGKKAELISRLVEDDKGKSASIPTSMAPAKGEDDITWEEEDDSATSNSRMNAASANSNQASNNQPLATQEPSAQKINHATSISILSSSPKNPNSTAVQTAIGTEATTAQNFSSGLPVTDVDAELEKRKKRAAKFGLPAPDSASTDSIAANSDAVKALERAKRFGTAAETNVMSKLDGALPERPQRRGEKRGSDAMLDGYHDQLSEDPGLKRSRGGRRKRGGMRDTGEDKQITSGGPAWMSDTDRAKAEARKNKWATPTTS